MRKVSTQLSTPELSLERGLDDRPCPELSVQNAACALGLSCLIGKGPYGVIASLSANHFGGSPLEVMAILAPDQLTGTGDMVHTPPAGHVAVSRGRQLEPAT